MTRAAPNYVDARRRSEESVSAAKEEIATETADARQKPHGFEREPRR